MLGICLGQQLMCQSSEEGATDCLGIFDTRVKKFPSTELVPHMGWNGLIDAKGELFNAKEFLNDVYFVHSYYAEISKETTTTSTRAQITSEIIRCIRIQVKVANSVPVAQVAEGTKTTLTTIDSIIAEGTNSNSATIISISSTRTQVSPHSRRTSTTRKLIMRTFSVMILQVLVVFRVPLHNSKCP